MSTKDQILNAAKKEFAAFGFNGGRVERIVASAGVSLRMVYHYFQDKDGLDLAVMEAVYKEVRDQEALLMLDDRPPEDAMRALVEFTYDHFLKHPEFVALVTSENLRKAATISKSRVVPDSAVPIMDMIQKILRRGTAAGQFRKGLDAVQLFITLHAVCYLHISNKSTMSAMLRLDLGNKAWLAQRRKHVTDVILRYLLR
jgi:TetR/AcrR family transcriptional regulator